MSQFAMFKDPFVWIGVVGWVVVFLLKEKVLSDGYHVRSLADEGPLMRIWKSEELHLILLTFFELPIYMWISRYVTDFLVQSTFLTKIFTIPLGAIPFLDDIRLTTYAGVMGILITTRWSVDWWRTINHMNLKRRASQIRTLGFMGSVMFGIGYGVMWYVALHPSEETIRQVLGQQIIIATNLLRSFQAGAGLGLAELASQFLWPIFINNFTLSIGSFVVGILGGVLVGAGLLSIIVSFSALMIPWGVFTGILIRQNLAAGKYFLGPPSSFIAAFGALPLGHTFHEFMAVGLAGVAGYFVGLGIITGSFEEVSWDGIVLGVVAGIYVLASAFLEVFVTPPIQNFAKGLITVEATLPSLSLKAGTTVGLVSAGGWILVVFIPFTAWLVRVTINFIEVNAQ